jgi:hypothetical protein
MAEQTLEQRIKSLEQTVEWLCLQLMLATSKEMCYCGHPRELHKPGSYCLAEEVLKITCHCGGFLQPEPKWTATTTIAL